MSNPANVSIVRISKQALLQWLDFEGGIIHGIRENPDRWHSDEVEIVIEHPDLDEVEDGDILRGITPVYIRLSLSAQERIDPPKRPLPVEVKV